MKSKDAKREFETALRDSGQVLGRLTPRAGVVAMCAFYRMARAEECPVREDGDMLLVQWGTYDWGQGEHFSFNITRQLIMPSGEDEDIWQLSLTFKFPPEASLRELGDGNRWCCRPEELGDFQSFIEVLPAYAAVAARDDSAVELDYECAG